MTQKIVINRNKTGLYIKFLVRVYDAHAKTLGNSRKDYIDFNTIHLTICRSFSMPKSEIMEYLRIFEELGYISFVKYRGIKLNYIVKDKNE